jgi:hypothetical protein
MSVPPPSSIMLTPQQLIPPPSVPPLFVPAPQQAYPPQSQQSVGTMPPSHSHNVVAQHPVLLPPTGGMSMISTALGGTLGGVAQPLPSFIQVYPPATTSTSSSNHYQETKQHGSPSNVSLSSRFTSLPQQHQPSQSRPNMSVTVTGGNGHESSHSHSSHTSSTSVVHDEIYQKLLLDRFIGIIGQASSRVADASGGMRSSLLATEYERIYHQSWPHDKVGDITPFCSQFADVFDVLYRKEKAQNNKPFSIIALTSRVLRDIEPAHTPAKPTLSSREEAEVHARVADQLLDILGACLYHI